MKLSRSLFLFLVFLLASALACSIGGGEEATVEPTAVPPTQAPAPTEPPPPPPTEPPAPTATTPVLVTKAPDPTQPPPTQPPQVGFELSSVAYEHPDAIFDLFPPTGWTAEDKIGGATFNAPDDSGFINIEVTNTALTLDGDAFERFVDARDFNLFGEFDGYEVISRQIDKDNGVARVTKRLSFDGIPQVVLTLYDQHSDVIFSLDFWAEADVAPVYQDGYEQIIDTATVYSDTADEVVDVYYWIYSFAGPGNLFTIDVPLAWRYEATVGDVATVDTFFSPDEHGIVQNISYDDGTEVSRSEAGAFALELLKQYYAADIRITDDQVQQDGSERLTWNSPGGDFSGISFLETRGTTFLLFSILWDNPFEEAYFSTLEYIVSTYDVP